MLQALSSAERVARAPSKLYPLLRGRGNWRIAQLLQDALPNIALDYANKQVGGGAPLFIYLPATSVAVPLTPNTLPLCVHTLHLSICLFVCRSVCLLVCLALCLPGCQSKRMGSRLKDAVDVEAGAALVRLPRGRRWLLLLLLMLPLLFVLVKQRRHEGGKGGEWRHTQKEKHEAAKNNSILSEK